MEQDWPSWLRHIAHRAADLEPHLAGFPGAIRRAFGGGTDPVVLHEDTLVYFIKSGELRVRIDQKTLDAVPGCLLCVPRGATFEFRVTTESGAGFNRFRLRGLPEHPPRPLAPMLPDAWDCEPAISRIVNELEAQAPVADLIIRAALLELFAHVARRAETPAEGRLLGPAERARLRRLIDEAWPENVSARQMAEELGLSHDYFTRLFTRSYGMSPRGWIIENRIRKAALILAGSTASVQEVAEEVGYENPKLFTRQFTKVMGQPPGRWRKSPGATPG